jgi:hypothetical protein
MTCLKYLSLFPCPRCLVTKPKVHLLGSASDGRVRRNHRRVDNEHRRQRVERARRAIYVKGVNISSHKIDEILGEGSLVPTRVCSSERFS